VARPEHPARAVRLGRIKVAGLAALFAAPIVASFVTYTWLRPEGGASFGELLLPPAQVSAHRFERPEGGTFEFKELAGKWVLVASDAGACPAGCREKLATMRQVRLALGRNAGRVERVFVVDDTARPEASALGEFAGTVVALSPFALPPGAGNDRAHIYLVDPNGNVMLRWAAGADRKRMLGDLQRLLKASQIG
jgi:cytochrome oxidase Cu insertion factor (SCO1/SenC/PrrC family)